MPIRRTARVRERGPPAARTGARRDGLVALAHIRSCSDWPRRPVGLNTRTRISTTNENTSFHSLPMPGIWVPNASEEAEHQPAEHGAGNGADAADHGGGECLEADQEAHEVPERAVIGPGHRAGRRGQRRADEERHANDRRNVDAHQLAHVLVDRDRAHRAAILGTLDEDLERRPSARAAVPASTI